MCCEIVELILVYIGRIKVRGEILLGLNEIIS